MNTKLATIFTLLVSILLVTGCNTIEGVGEDIERGGEKIQDATE